MVKSLNVVQSNCLPLSTVTSFGTPKRHTMFCQKNFCKAPTVISLRALASTHFVTGCGLLSGGGFVLRSCRCCRVCRSGSSVALLLRRHVVWRGVSNRRVGAKLLVASASGTDE